MSDQALTLEACLPAILALGRTRDGSFVPAGTGVLFLDSPLVWLLTAASVATAADAAPLGAWISADGEGTVLDLTTGRRGTPLDWLVDTTHDLAACLFPIDPRWPIKAFPEARCASPEVLAAGLPVLSVGYPWGVAELGRAPTRVVLPGLLAQVDAGAGRLLTTAPLLPLNAGAPLVVAMPAEAGGGMGLVGLLTRSLAVPEPAPGVAPVRLTLGSPVTAALALVRSDAGRAQRRLAIDASRAASAPP
jgi:hypothetical protein